MFKLNKINSKLIFFTCLFIFLCFSTAEKADAFPEFDFDGKADFGVFRPSERTWHSYSSESETSTALKWGFATDVLVPADYDGDGLTDITVWRPSNGVWYVNRSRDNKLFAIQWGMTSVYAFGSILDVPVPGDYDGDGLADFAVWRPETGIWYVLQSSDGYNPVHAKYFQWGRLGDVPVPADYDGDGRTDIAVFRSTGNRWYIQPSKIGQPYSVNFGQAGEDLLVPADYTGDKKADLAVYRNGTWIIRRSENNQSTFQQFGLDTDKPVPADYNRDGQIDIAVYRNGTWYILEGSTQRFSVFYYGSADDIPLAWLNVKESIVAVP
jgi:hypothetical protein